MMIILVLMALGVVIETIARLLPTKSPDSALTKIGLSMGKFGSNLVSAGKFVEGFLNFIKFPNNLKK